MSGDHVREGRALDELEDERTLARSRFQTVDGADVRVIESGQQLGFELESVQSLRVCDPLGRQNLDRDVAA
jgi:hypothetical protein